MNYKVLIILLTVLFLVVLIYKEISSLKSGIAQNIDDLILGVKENSDNMVTKLQQNMIRCVTQIRDVSSDNLQQLERITKLNYQPITKIANHFTETDVSEIHDINYLSEVRDRKNVFEKNQEQVLGHKKDSNFYMSEESDASEDSELLSDKYKSSKPLSKTSSEGNLKQEVVCDGDVCYVTSKLDNTNLTHTEIPVYVSASVINTVNEQIVVDFPVYGDSKIEVMDESNEDEEDQETSEVSDDNMMIDDESYVSEEISEVDNTLNVEPSDDVDVDVDGDVDQDSDENTLSTEMLMVIEDDKTPTKNNLVKPRIIKIKDNAEDGHEIEVDILNMITKNSTKQNNLLSLDSLPNIIPTLSQSMMENISKSISDHSNLQEEEEDDDINSEEIDIPKSVFQLINNTTNGNGGNSYGGGIKIEEIHDQINKNSESSEAFNLQSTEESTEDSASNYLLESPKDDDTVKPSSKNVSESESESTPVKKTSPKQKKVAKKPVKKVAKKPLKKVTKKSDKQENKSVDLNVDNLEDLQIFSSYSIQDLRQLSKSMSLSLSHVKDGKRVYYKKKDMYENIKTHLK